MIARTSVVIISGMLATLRGPRTGLWGVRSSSPQLLTTLAAGPDPAVASTRRGRHRRPVSPPEPNYTSYHTRPGWKRPAEACPAPRPHRPATPAPPTRTRRGLVVGRIPWGA